MAQHGAALPVPAAIKATFNPAGYSKVADGTGESRRTDATGQAEGKYFQRFSMNGLYALFASAALLLPVFGQGEAVPGTGDIVRPAPPNASPVQHQVRIEERVIIRISPQSGVMRQSLMADLPQAAAPPRYEERKMEKCVPVSGIAGVQTGSGNRLLLYLRDHRLVTANLGKACRARDFYSGFYIERNADGLLCVDRDKLQSRAGANCEIKRMRQLVPVSE